MLKNTLKNMENAFYIDFCVEALKANSYLLSIYLFYLYSYLSSHNKASQQGLRGKGQEEGSLRSSHEE